MRRASGDRQRALRTGLAAGTGGLETHPHPRGTRTLHQRILEIKG